MIHLNTEKTPREKLIKSVLLMLAGIAILLGATFAWRDLSQHRTNPWGDGRDTNTRNVTLNDDFIPPKTIVVDEEIPKTVSVSNMADSGGLACVRLSLKEFMELRKHQTELYYTDEAGVEILFATFADGSARQGEYMTVEEAVALGFKNYGSFSVPQGFDILNPDPAKRRLPLMVEYATTNNAEPRNGIYGKPMLIPGDLLEMWGDAPRANLSHSVASTAECDYTPYFWWQENENAEMVPAVGALPLIGEHTIEDKTITTGPLREYVTLNGDPVITLEQWSTNEGKTEVGNGHLRDAWIVDEKDGWVYWANRIEPGKTTTNLLDSVTFEENPATIFPGTNQVEYYIHVDMHATDETQEEIVGVFGDVDDPNVDTLEELADKVSPEKLDLLTKLVYGARKVTFVENPPSDLDGIINSDSMPQPQLVSAGNKAIEPATNPTTTDPLYRFRFWSTSADGSDGAFDFTKKIENDTELFAIWAKGFRFKMRIGDDDPSFAVGTSHPDTGKPSQVTLAIGGTPLTAETSGNDFIVDWGAAGAPTLTPGVTEDLGNNRVRYKGTVPVLAVRYQYDASVTGEVEISITGTMPQGMKFSFINRTEVGDNGTYGDRRLIEVFTPFLPSTPTNAFRWAFTYCENLTTIPEDLFANNPQAEDFSVAFFHCTSLTTIPEKLFANNPLVTTFQSTFNSCIGLKTTTVDGVDVQPIPAGLFDNNPLVKSFNNTFSACTGLTSVPPTLFDKNKAGAPYNGINDPLDLPLGRGVTHPTLGPVDNIAKINFSSTFSYCTGLNGKEAGTDAPAIWETHRSTTDTPQSYRDTTITSLTGFDHDGQTWK